ncbi:hypothetical protein RRG08_031966 [Elysia crispata]|uniref:Uncharacterized protein n=1 Tax=Elysia crispata TaxID=231223 RepID=A0AAE0Z3Z4_9GAST|nr:hypothetical protein RRG08_031966 [Elysia crispata]
MTRERGRGRAPLTVLCKLDKVDFPRWFQAKSRHCDSELEKSSFQIILKAGEKETTSKKTASNQCLYASVVADCMLESSF